MNRSISKLYVCVLVLFALLIVWTSRWTVFSASALDNNKLNKLGFFATEKVKRGKILASDGTTVLAKSVPNGGGTWKRSYPQSSLFSQTVGYNNIQQGQSTGLEQQFVKQLLARQSTTLSSVFGPISTSNVGNDVDTTLNVPAQTEARALLAGRVGSVVAIVPQTGAVPVMYSNPSYDDNAYAKARSSCSGVTDVGLNSALAASCQLNLATQEGLPPGSTFKVVTATAALNTGKYTPDTTIDGKSPITVSGKALENDDNEQYGDISLTDALVNSVNTVFAQVGLDLGRVTMEDYMKRFGFYAKPSIDLPSTDLVASGERNRTSGRLVLPTSSYVDLGRMSIGQDALSVTPLQMAMVASAVADGGKLMEPRLATKVVNPDGQVVQTVSPKLYDTVMTSKTASELNVMMRHVVEEGTGQSANLDGLNAAGKTGTASTGAYSGGVPVDESWFIGFAPATDPKIAVAVVLPNIPNGYGADYAAPVAAKMMQTLLQEGL